MGEQTGRVQLPDIIAELAFEDSGTAVRNLAERVKLALDLLNNSIDAGGGGIYYNFLSYGGVADGVTDNSTALNALITTVTAAGGGTIYFPEGNYAFTGTITTTDFSNITFLGDGVSSTLTLLAGVADWFVLAAGCTLNNLRLDRGAFSTRFVVINTAGGGNNLYARYLLNCTFIGTSTTIGIDFTNLDLSGFGTVIHNCRFNFPATYIIQWRNVADMTAGRYIISNCLYNNSSSINLAGSFGVIIIGCHGGNPAFVVGGGLCKRATIVGNRFDGTGTLSFTADQTVLASNVFTGLGTLQVNSTCTNIEIASNSYPAATTINVNCFSASNNSIFFPRRSYGVTILNPGGFTLGDGQVQGFVEWLGQHVSVQIGLQWGTTTFAAIPAAGFIFSLPTNNGVSSPFGSVFPIGTGMAFNGNAFGLYAYCTPSGVNALVGNMNNNNVTTPLDPIVPVNTNRYQFNLHYPWA